MGKTATQFRLLLWKNYVLQKRKILVTVFEIGLPTLFALLLIFIRQRVESTDIDQPTTWRPFYVETWPDQLSKKFPSQMPQLAFTPNNNLTKQIMLNVEGVLRTKTKGLTSEKDLVDFLLFTNSTMNNTKDYIGGIVFTSITSEMNVMPKNISYKIRLSFKGRNSGRSNPFSQGSTWKTSFTYPAFQLVGPRKKDDVYGGEPGYYREGFLTIQRSIDKAVIEYLNSSAQMDNISVQLKRMPYPPYFDDQFVLVIQLQLPLIIMLSFVFSALQIVKDVVHEKERKLKESLKMMGVNNWLHWTAWFIKYLIFLIISVFIITLFLCVKIPPKGSVIGNSDPTLIFVFLLLYAVSTIFFCFAVSVFFSKANSAAAAGGILFFISYIPYFFLQPRYDSLSLASKILPCLISNVGMAFGGQVIGMFEGTGSGVTWQNFYQPVSVDDDFTLLHVMLMFIVDAVLYGLVAWYIEAVFPGEYGIPQKWYFPFQKVYWCGRSNNDVTETTPLLQSSRVSEYFEKDPVGMRVGVKIDNLRKEFTSNGVKKTAVAGMTLNMYEGQITALLGHNGAGKTTTMSMLTGFIPCTSGTAYVNGHCINNDIASVRESLGLCPQHDVLFDTLTVEEHLFFFAKLKGYPSEKVPAEIERMLNAVGLSEKRKALAKTLSGGQKRKLSVASALIGDSKIVILDEPSSGMDPSARRHIWDVLQRFRTGRTLLLTTHFMDEADVLGDRIAIMADGVLKCYGTSLFLKNKYGAGYHMVIVKLAGCDVGAITDVVHKYVPRAHVESDVSAELSYILPQDCSGMFEDLFTELEDRKDELRIGSFGASVTTMEEVFMRVGEGSEEGIKSHPSSNRSESITSYGAIDEQDKKLGQLVKPQSVFGTPVIKNSGFNLYLQQFVAMFIKRFLNTLRSKVVTVAQLAVPLFFTISALIVVKTMPTGENSPSLLLSLAQFSKPVVTVANRDSEQMYNLSTAYMAQFRDKFETVNVSDVDQYLVEQGKESLANYNNHYIVGATFSSIPTPNIIAHFNNQPFHAPPISLAAADSSLLHYFVNSSYTFYVANQPLPKTTDDEVNDKLSRSTEGFTIAFNILFGMSFLASSFVLFLVRERATKSKHIQFVSGVHAINYWASTFAWDFINLLIPCCLLLVVFAAFDIQAYTLDGRLALVLLVFALYAWAVLPFMYLLSFIFTVPSTGLVWLTMFNIISGVATILAVDILSIPQLDLMDLAKALEWVFFSCLPNFNLGQALQDIYSNYEANELCGEVSKEIPIPNINLAQFCDMLPIVIPNVINLTTFPCCKGKCGDNCLNWQDNYLTWEADGIGRMLVFLAIQGVIYFGLVFLIESDTLRRLRYMAGKKAQVVPVPVRMMPSNSHPVSQSNGEVMLRQVSRSEEDIDVIAERERIMNEHHLINDRKGDSVVLHNVTRYFGPLTAVDHISVGIPQLECFGLLGVNGAGKTTTFKMLTGDEYLSEGEAFLNQYSVKSEIKQVQQSLGYCPQFDALLDMMTVRETLYMYARLRGVKEWQIKTVIWELVSSLLLQDHIDKLVKDLSGGNKRKLSTAIALTGDPPIIFLDEPSTGMDPVARRHLWNVLTKVRESGKTLVLTSHSMEECEALCTRIAIMVNGVFKCLGSTQHLKTKFGDGYTLIAKVGYNEGQSPPDLNPLRDFIEKQFPGSILKDIHEDLVHYHVTNDQVSWAKIFGIMERAKTTYNIEDYSVSQTTLEQVFLNFARAQVAPTEHRLGCCSQCLLMCGACCQ